MNARLARTTRVRITPRLPARRFAASLPVGPLPWPGADPALGPSLFLDQLGLWDAVVERESASGPPDGPRFRAAGCCVRRIPARGSARLVGDFLAANHYSAGPGMRGLNYGLYRGSDLLGVAVFSRVCRPRWAAENFALQPADYRRSPRQRRHLTVTEAEYAALSRLALTPADSDGAPLGNGAATWFLSRCLAVAAQISPRYGSAASGSRSVKGGSHRRWKPRAPSPEAHSPRACAYGLSHCMRSPPQSSARSRRSGTFGCAPGRC